MNVSRKIISSEIGLKDYSKSASGFINDFTGNAYVTPNFIRITDADALQFYKANEWINATVNKIIESCVKLNPKVVLKDKSSKPKPRHERTIEFINDFFESPNTNKESFRELRIKFLKDMLVYGRGTIEKVFKGTVLNELYSLKADTMTVMLDDNGMIAELKAYKQRVNNKKKLSEIFFNKNEVIFKVFRPTTESIYGEKPLDTLANAVASDILRATYNSNFFVNGGEASGILSLEGMPKSELQKFRQYWKDNHVGVNKAHRMIAVNTKLNYARMAITNRDMEFTSYGRELRNKIFAVYGMQPVIMGLSDDTTSKIDPDKQNVNYKEYCLTPILMIEAETYLKEILKNGFGLDEYEIIFPGIDTVERDAQSLMDERDIKNGVLTINEVRVSRGMPEVPWGDTPMSVLPGGNQVDPDTGRIVPPSQQGNGTATAKPKPTAKKPKPKKHLLVEDCDIEYGMVYDRVMKAMTVCDTLKNINAEKVLEMISISDLKFAPADEAMFEGSIKMLVERYKANETIDYTKLSADVLDVVTKTLGDF